LSKHVQQQVPIFKIAADQGTHPPVGLDRPVCVVGRHDYANLPLPAKAVSKLHALIVREQRRVYLRDLASTNGVDVNGEAVRETELSDADVIRIGAFTLRCQSGFGKDGVRPDVDGNGSVGGDGAGAPQAELRSAAGNVSFPPGRHTLLIGQRDGCEVRLKHESILPVHAVVFELDGKHYIQTFAPEYATRVNGKPVHREALQPGDELRIGNVTLRYALVDLAADSVGQPAAASDTSGGTGDSLIAPVLDSSIVPAIAPAAAAAADDPAHHGELEADHADDAFDVVDTEAEESRIQPAMDSSIVPAPSAALSSAPSAETPAAEETEDFGLDIEPLEPLVEPAGDGEPLAEASLDVEPLDVADDEADDDAAKPSRPAAPPEVAAKQPARPAIREPVIEPVVERAAEHGIAAAVDPVVQDSPPAPGQAAGDDMGRSIEFDGDSSFDLEPLQASDDFEPIDINAEPDAAAEAAGGGAGAGGGGTGGVGTGGADAGDLADAIRATWDGPKQRDISKLSATYDEDSELGVVDAASRSADLDPLAASFGDDGDDGAVMPLTDASADDADLLGVADHSDLVEPVAEQPEAEPIGGTVPAPAVATPPPGATPATPAPSAADVAGAVASLTSQAAKLTELAKAAGLSDEKRAAAGADATPPVVTAQDITQLIEDVAAKVQALRVAWTAYQAQHARPAGPATPAANTPRDAQQDEPFEFKLADAPPASSSSSSS
jgi:pSer/pThr/pTyr-binding forkhead associated (FHA) protein